MDTAELAEALAKAAKPVRVIRSPLVRTGRWLLLAPAVTLLLAAGHGFRPDLLHQLSAPSFAAGLAASSLTGASAAFGSLAASLPDRSRRWLLLPLPCLAVWMATLGHGCLTDWVGYDAGSLRLGGAVRCVVTVLLVSLPLSISLFAMLRHTARLRPTAVSLVAGLAVAGVTSTAMSLLYRLDATVLNLTLNLGATGLAAAVEAIAAGRLLSRMAASTRKGR